MIYPNNMGIWTDSTIKHDVFTEKNGDVPYTYDIYLTIASWDGSGYALLTLRQKFDEI